VTYLGLLDESGREVRQDRWFLYGGILVDSRDARELARGITRIKNRAGYRPDTPFKWTRPPTRSISREKHDKAVTELLALCTRHGANLFVVMTPAMVTVRTSRDNTSIRFGIGYVLNMMQQFLKQVDAHALVSVDTFAGGSSLPAVEQVLREGIPAGIGGSQRRRRFNRVLLSGITSVRSNSLSPLIDVPLGAFGHCLMGHSLAKARELYPELRPLIHRLGSQGTPWNLGLRIRPIDIVDPGCARLVLATHERLVALGESPAPGHWVRSWKVTAGP
jgi:hypothetical protein